MKRNSKVLPQKFFERPVVRVAKDLLGKTLVREINGKKEKFIITETEAYDGPEDLACHAAKGRTKRTEVMFGKAGVWYVYLVYGMYYMINVVTGDEEYPAAVLIRGAKKIEKDGSKINLNGPGKLSKYLKVDKTFTGKEALPSTGLWFEENEQLNKKSSGKLKTSKKKIVVTPRIGINYAGPIWSQKLYRFVLEE